MDIGRGTQDVLLYRPGTGWENSIQMVLPSPTVLLAGTAAKASELGLDLLFTGETMGGGPLTLEVRRHLASGGRAWATPAAAATFDDDPEEVRAMGIEIVGDEEAPRLSARPGIRAIRTGDVNLDALRATLDAWGEPFAVGAAAGAVQDHGRAPRGASDRRFRVATFRERLGAVSALKELAYTGEDLPGVLTRMQGVKRSLDGCGPLLFMDTGFATLLGALDDPRVGAAGTKLLLNVGNGHALAGLVEGEVLAGFVEHHTRCLDRESLEDLLDGLVSGGVDDDEVYGAGGHGAFLREGAAFPHWEGIDVFAATGPRRSMAEGLRHTPYMAAPHGQMMFTGTYGLYRAFEARWGPYEG